MVEHSRVMPSAAFAVQLLMVVLLVSVGSGKSATAQEVTSELAELDDIPEEVLQTELILHGRSPIDGELLSPADYAQLQDQLQIPRGEVPGRVAPSIHRSIFLLRLRKVVITLFPFLE